MNILQITQQAIGELGSNLSIPNTLIGNNDPSTRQFLFLLARVGRDLVKDFEWERLVTEGLITTVVTNSTGTTTAGSPVITGIPSTAGLSTNYGVAGNGIPPFAQIISVDSATQVTLNMVATESGTGALNFAQVNYPLPSDWSRQIPQTEWDRTNSWPLNGPKSSQEWQNFKSGIVYAGPRLRFRIAGGAIQLNPVPSASGTLSYEYISANWLTGADGTRKADITADTDTPIFDENLIVAALKLRWLQSKGLTYDYAMDDYMRILEKMKSQDKSAPKLWLSQSYSSVLLSNQNIQDGSWPAQ